MPDFERLIRNNPLVLLETVERHMHAPEKEKYPTLTLIEVLLSFIEVNQDDNEDMFDYLSRFNTERYILM